MLQGKELKEPATAGQYKNAMYLPIPFIDGNNLADAAKAVDGKPGYYSYTSQLSRSKTPRSSSSKLPPKPGARSPDSGPRPRTDVVQGSRHHVED